MSREEKEGGFISHLAELRKRLIHSFIFLVIFFKDPEEIHHPFLDLLRMLNKISIYEF